MVIFEQHGVNEKELFRYFLLQSHQFPFHFHRAYELIYVNSGELYVSIDQKEYQLEENDLAFIFTNQIHEFKVADCSQVIIILFSPELIGDFYINYKGLIPDDNILHLKEKPDLEKLNCIYSQKSFLYALSAELISQKSFSPVNQSPQTKALYKILLYIEQNYSTDCTLKTIAKHLKYYYPYLSKLFVDQMNMTFTQYLNNYRISQACYLLKNSYQPIGEIALDCGYSNLRTFHRNFRKITNMSPKEYRELD